MMLLPRRHPNVWRASAAAGPGALLLLCLTSVAAPGAVAAAAPAVLAAGLLVGVPHGAFDHRVASGDRPGTNVVGRYLLLAGVVLLGFVADPPLAFALLLAVSIAHFAEGEVVFGPMRDRRPGDLRDLLGGITSGTAMVVLPLLTHPGGAERLISEVIGRPLPLPGPGGRDVLVAAVAVAAAVSTAALVAGRRTLQGATLALVVLAGCVAPAGAAFGVMFATVHAAHHTARLVASGPAQAPARVGRPRGGSVALLAPLAVAVGGGALLYVAAPMPWLRLVLGGMLALTVPHAVVVHGMGRPPVTSPRRRAGTHWKGATAPRPDDHLRGLRRHRPPAHDLARG